MPLAQVDSLQIAYDERGTGEPLLLIMGVGAQLTLWPPEFCAELAAHGFRVVRFDNRDVGRSTHLSSAPVPSRHLSLLRRLVGGGGDVPYTLSDMARDVVGLQDALGMDSAHLLGMSMGGMIAQTVAIEHPQRVRSLNSFASGAGDVLPLPTPLAMSTLLSPEATTRAEAVAKGLRFQRLCGSTHFVWNPTDAAQVWGDAFDRSHDPDGFARQLAAILASGSRSPHLHRIRCPTLVLHGLADPLIPPEAARKMARAIPGARLRLIEGLGHDLPLGVWPTVIAEVVSNARRA